MKEAAKTDLNMQRNIEMSLSDVLIWDYFLFLRVLCHVMSSPKCLVSLIAFRLAPLHRQRSCCLRAGSSDILGRDIWFRRGSRSVQEAWSLSVQMGHNSSETSAFWELHLSAAKHNDQTVDRRLSTCIFIESNSSHQPLIVTGIKHPTTCRMLMFLRALFVCQC